MNKPARVLQNAFISPLAVIGDPENFLSILRAQKMEPKMLEIFP